MVLDNKDIGVFTSTGSVMAICGITQTSEVFQLIQVIIGVIAGAVALAYTIWRWYKNAKKDGKITKDEVDDLFEDINNTINDIKGDKDNGNRD